jgi:hypothetical protein
MLSWPVPPREEVFMEGPIEPNMGPTLADVLLCTFESTNAGFSSIPVKKLLPEGNYSSPTAFSLKRNPASSGQHREVN